MRKTIVILMSAVLFGLVNPGPAETPAVASGQAPAVASGQAPADLSKIAGWKGAAVNSPDTFRFVILSDRTGGHIPGFWAKAVAETNRLKPDFVITIGDLIEGYIEDEKEIRRQWKEIDAMTRKLDAPFFYCPGNHDAIPDACRKIYTELHGVKGKAWYSFDYRRCHFLVADSSAMIGKDKKLADDQWTWLKEDLARANKTADHVFVFIHHPMFYGRRKPHWDRLRAMLDAKKTTVFSGHWHSPLCYDLTDGVPYYVLSATAAGAGGAPKQPNRALGEFQSYAHVVVDKGKPTVSIIPLGEVLPHDFVDRTAIERLLEVSRAATLGAVTSAGGEVTLNLPGPADAEATCTLTWTGKGEWFLGGLPKTETLTIPAGKTAERTYRIRPSSKDMAPPVLTVRHKITAEGRTLHRSRELPLKIVATLTAGSVKGITIDGKLDDWAGVTAHATTARDRVKLKPEAWSGPKDCSHETRIGYDDKNLYLAIDVTDEATATEGAHTWERDGVMIVWDSRPAGQRDGKFAGGPCRQVIVPVPAGEEKPSVTVWPKDPAVASAVRAAYRRREGGYVIELAIPFSAMGSGLKPAAGRTLGLEVLVHDKDEATPRAAVKCMVLSGGADAWRTTAGYAVVTLR